MENYFINDVMKQAIKVALLISSPMLIGALFMGILVSLFQAVTQINEQTLSFIPKILVMTITDFMTVEGFKEKLSADV